MNSVIIVESPSKSKTIASYLGDGFTVLSSKGHICDLATTGKDGLGIDIPSGFIPNYKIMKEKESLVEQLKKACKGKKVYLATDPDREGEAIAYHLATYLDLNLNDLNRVEFNEITKNAVLEAIENPHNINLKMVESQEARRMIDRILGFKLSKLLQRKIGSKSAGRVQSVALMLIVNLEKQIQAFVPITYFEMEALFKTFKLKLHSINDSIIDSKNRITDKEILKSLKDRLLSFTVSNITSKQIKRNSYPAYTTSTMQQEASNKLGFNATKTMRIAQGLYEGKNIGVETVGLITYMRTDSTRLANTFVKDCNDYILNNFGSKYLGNVKIKGQKNMQDAHEAIRPTSIERTPDSLRQYLTDDEYKLYNLIYKRALASLMSNAVYNTTKVEFTNTDSVWTTSGQQMVFDGYLKVYGKSDEDENDNLPAFKLGESFNADQIKILEKQTQAPSRYTEASLIKDMEELGIGRPSTYAQTMQTLKDREYIKVEKKSLVPTEQGILTTDKLLEFFNTIINVEYTANMETNLDMIANGKKNKLEELKEFYEAFEPVLDNAAKNMKAIYPIRLEEECPECGSPLFLRLGKYGEFVSCSNYPHCRYIKKEEQEDNNDTNIVCPECGNANIIKKVASRGKNKGHIFYACGNYPKCKNIYNDEPTLEKCPNCNSIMLKNEQGELYCSKNCSDARKNEAILCPECGNAHMVKKIATRGKNKGNAFYACGNYPKCKNVYNDEPTLEKCPNCNSIMLKNKDGILYCSKNCVKADSIDIANQNIITDTIKCPNCNKGTLVERVAARGKNKGNVFYGCNNYPRCKTLITIDEYNELKRK